MLDRFILLVIRWRFIVLISMFVWAVYGSLAVYHTPIDLLPDMSDNQVLVYTPWSGQDPLDIESKITQPLSVALRKIEGLRSIRGSSEVGFSLVHCIFDDRIGFLDARQRIEKTLLDLPVSMPKGVVPQLASEGIPTGQIVWYTLSGVGVDLLELRNWQIDVIGPRIATLPGVAEVACVGGMDPEIVIEADPEALATAGISFGDFERQLHELPPVQKVQSGFDQSTNKLESNVRDIGKFLVSLPDKSELQLEKLSRIELQPSPRFGVFEKDGNELVAGVVHLRVGENPLKVSQAVIETLRQLSVELPENLRLSPCYDRSPLIVSAVSNLSRSVFEAILVSTLGIWLLMRHFRTSLVIGLTLPLSVLGAFIGISMLIRTGSTMNVNVMSLAGIAISIGVLVDSSIVIVDNITHQLHQQYGSQIVSGDTSEIVAKATVLVARPAIFSILIMLISFLPLFALQGIDGKMYRPLAWTKTFSLVSVLLLSVTVVPALASYLIRGRLRDERDSSIIRAFSRVYRPCLLYLFDNAWPLILMLSIVSIAASATTGSDLLIRLVTVSAIAAMLMSVNDWWRRVSFAAILLIFALTLQNTITPIQTALRFPWNEGMIMDMPITIPRITTTQAIDDLKQRNMTLCRFPEVRMVTGKAGRADTAFDPAPMSMIETMVEFRSSDEWPRRRVMRSDATYFAGLVVREMAARGLIESPIDAEQFTTVIEKAVSTRFDAIQRECCWQLQQVFEKKLGQELTITALDNLATYWHNNNQIPSKLQDFQIRNLATQVDWSDRQRLCQQLDKVSLQIMIRQLVARVANELQIASNVLDAPTNHPKPFKIDLLLSQLKEISNRRWSEFVAFENQSLYRRSGKTWIQIAIEETCNRSIIVDQQFADKWEQILAARYATADSSSQHHSGEHGGMPSYSKLPIIFPYGVYDELVDKLSNEFSRRVWLWPHTLESLAGPEGELDSALQMPGWANVWTRPIQNRIDMLSTGVTSEVGVRVQGDSIDSVVEASEIIADALRQIPGAVNVLCDPIRDKDYIEAKLDLNQANEMGLDRQELQMACLAALSGYMIPYAKLESTGIPIRLRLSSRGIETRGPLDVTVPLMSRLDQTLNTPNHSHYNLSDLATIQHRDGPSTIKSENGLLRNYVRLNVRDSNVVQWVRNAQSTLKDITLPEGVSMEWTGQYEHAARTRSAMFWIIPLCIATIGLLLFCVFFDLADTFLMMIAVPGALAGGALCQWFLNYPFSLAVGVGYIACFGMAAATSMVMLVYLRQAIFNAGGLESLSLAELKVTVIDGAVHRLRPKLLTESIMILGLAPLLWSTGFGADVVRPMAAPVLGGILIADEVVDLLIPVLFYSIRKNAGCG